MNFDTASIVTSTIVGSVGFVAFVYGQKQRRLPQLVTGTGSNLLMQIPTPGR